MEDVMHRIGVVGLFFVALLCTHTAQAISFDQAIKAVDPQKKYLFYLHGAILEDPDKGGTSPRYGVYAYDSIIEHFEDRDLIVIEEIRSKTSPRQYAAVIVQRVRRLMAAGIPPHNITVSGFSKGGHIALLVASSLGNPNVRYVLMAGCGRGGAQASYQQFLKRKRGMRLTGNILSIYAGSDMDAGSCREAIDQAQDNSLRFREIRLRSSKGHGMFYQPRPQWIDLTARFARGEQ